MSLPPSSHHAEQFGPNDPRLRSRYDRIRELFLNGDLNGALSELQRALQDAPNDPVVHNDFGSFLLRRGRREDLDKALAEFRESLRITPDAQVHSNVGITLWRMGQIDEAAAELREVVRLDPQFPLGHNNLGLVLLSQQHTEDAIAEFREAMRLDPDYADPHYNLGNALLGECIAKGLDDFSTPISEYREALRLMPNYALAHFRLGDALRAKGDWDGAIAEYRESLRQQPNDPEFHNHLAYALGQMGDAKGAIAELREALRLAPSDHRRTSLAFLGKLARPKARSSSGRTICSLFPMIPRHMQHWLDCMEASSILRGSSRSAGRCCV